jgi:hypothetical protein
MSGRRPVVKIIAESLLQHDEKHVVPTPLSGIRVGGRRRFISHTYDVCVCKKNKHDATPSTSARYSPLLDIGLSNYSPPRSIIG